MPNYVSPGNYVIEKDISEYAPTVNSSVVGVVGFASKGPTNKATLITSPQNLINTFGQPNEDIAGQALEGSLEILEQTNSLYFIRAADSTSATASATIAMGACPAIQVSAGAFGGGVSSLYLRVQVTDNDGNNQFASPKVYSIPSGTTTGSLSSQGAAIQSVVGGELDSAKVGFFYDSTTSDTGWLVGSFAGSGASMSVSSYSNASLAAGVPALRQMGLTGGVSGNAVTGAFEVMQAYGMSIDSGAVSSLTYQIQSLHPGAGYNGGTKVNGDTSGNSISISALGGPHNLVRVNGNGASEETFKVSLVTDKDFVEDKINTGGVLNLTSDVILGSLFASGADMATVNSLSSFIVNATGIGTGILHGTAGQANVNTRTLIDPRFIKMIEGTTNMSGGGNGIPTTAADKDTALIGDAAVTPKTGMQALDDEVLNISVAIVPGITTQNTQNALITLAEATQAFLAVVSTPFGIGSVQNAIDWTNGQSDTRTAAINSNYAATYWPWVQTFSVHDGKDRWFDPGIYAVRQMMFTDSVSDPWFAAAGFVRGRLTKPTDVEVKVNQGDRDAMYSGGNVLNPIVNFPQQGITIFGQRTTQRNPTALDRVNVRRLMIQIRKVILASTRKFVFEPNDEFTWTAIEGSLNPFLDNIKRRRGIEEFRVVCDDTTNTPARVDRNELWCKVLVKPTKTAEILVFEVNLTNQSAQLGG